MTGVRGGARASDDWVERVRAASDIVEIVGQTVGLKRVGRNFVGRCPFHEEKTPSFSVHPERQFYHCFSCKAGGDVFKFVQESEKVGFLEAVELLSRRAGIPVPERRQGERSVRGPLLECLEAAAVLYEQWLADAETGREARAYLERRGLDRDVCRAFRVGLAPPGWENAAARLRGRFGDETLLAAGLAVRREGGRGGLYDRFRNRLMVPLVATGSAVVGFGARALDPKDEPKYLNSPESAVYHKSSFLFGLDHARRAADAAAELVVVEGYMDVIGLHQHGIANVVATSGTALTADHAKQLKRVAGRVVLTYDGDRAGQAAARRSLATLLAEGLDVEVITLPEGHDPDSLVREHGEAGWNEARRTALDPVTFLERQVAREPGPGDARERGLKAVVDLALVIPDPIRVRLLFERASQVFRLEADVLRRALELKRAGFRVEQPIQAAVRVQARREVVVEHELLQALLHDRDALDDVREAIGPDDLSDPVSAALARRLFDGEPAPEEGPEAELARSLWASAEQEMEWRRTAIDAARRLKERRLDRQSGMLRRRMDELEQQGRVTDPEFTELQRAYIDLRRSIGELKR